MIPLSQLHSQSAIPFSSNPDPSLSPSCLLPLTKPSSPSSPLPTLPPPTCTDISLPITPCILGAITHFLRCKYPHHDTRPHIPPILQRIFCHRPYHVGRYASMQNCTTLQYTLHHTLLYWAHSHRVFQVHIHIPFFFKFPLIF